MNPDLWAQTVDTAITADIIAEAPPDDAYRTDLAQAALDGIDEDTTGDAYEKPVVEITPGGE
jgi:hypothetical protein